MANSHPDPNNEWGRPVPPPQQVPPPQRSEPTRPPAGTSPDDAFNDIDIAPPLVTLYDPNARNNAGNTARTIVITCIVVVALILAGVLFSDRIRAALGGAKCPVMDYTSEALAPLRAAGPIDIGDGLAFIPKTIDSHARDCEPLSWVVAHGTTAPVDSFLDSDVIRAADQTPALIALPLYDGTYTGDSASPIFPGSAEVDAKSSGGRLTISWDNEGHSARFSPDPAAEAPLDAADIVEEFSDDDAKELPRISPIIPEQLGGSWPGRSWRIEDLSAPTSSSTTSVVAFTSPEPEPTTKKTTTRKTTSRKTTAPSSSRAASGNSLGDCSPYVIGRDLGIDPSEIGVQEIGKYTAVKCDGKWASFGHYATDGGFEVYWDGTKWINPAPKPDGTTRTGFPCYSKDTLAQLPEGAEERYNTCDF